MKSSAQSWLGQFGFFCKVDLFIAVANYVNIIPLTDCLVAPKRIGRFVSGHYSIMKNSFEYEYYLLIMFNENRSSLTQSLSGTETFYLRLLKKHP